MKKRKFPAGLIIALVVLLGGAGAYSLINTKAANMSEEEVARALQEQAAQEQADQAARNPAPPPNATVAPAAEVRSQVRSATQGEAARPRGDRRGGPEAEPGTSIIAPKATPYKPVPNESATSSQWFNKK